MKPKMKLYARCLCILLAVQLAAPTPAILPMVFGETLANLSGAAIDSAPQIHDAASVSLALADVQAGQPVAGQFSTSPTDAEIFTARIFDEPLVPTDSQPQPAENQALAAALLAYANRSLGDDCSSLADFADNNPPSRWTASLLLHLGTEYYKYGYFSKALDAWQRSWALFQTNSYPPAKPQADRALGELARMYSRVGRVGQLSELLDSARDRDLEGPAVQLVQSSKEALWIMKNKPDYAFSCGPSALDRILLHFAPAKAGSPVLLDCKSGTNGFSLNQVAEISKKLGMNYQMAYRQPGSALVFPSVVHWNIGHYAALIERRGDRILLQDYTFPASFWVSERAINAESSGYFLVPSGTLPEGWRPVSESEGQSVWGKGQTNGKDPNASSKCHDKSCGGTSCSQCQVNTNPTYQYYLEHGGPLPHGPLAPYPSLDPIPPPQSGQFDLNSHGMTTYTMHALLATLTLEDTPLSFNSPFGPQVAFTATYNQSEANQPAEFYYSNLGPDWDCSWLSYVTDNPESPGADVSLYLDNGGTLEFNNYNPANQSYAPEVMSQAVLVLVTNASYELRYSDGSRREYTQSDGSTGSTRRIFLTQVIDAAGNAMQLHYDSQLRITNVVNAIGQATTLFYTNTAYPFAITSVVDPFGRSAQLLYNTNGLLIQITDALGLTSRYTYGANQFITALTTPYGTTTFTSGSTNGGNYLTATDPLGGTEAVEYSQSLPVPTSDPAAAVPHGISTFNLFLDARDTFYWDKKAFAEGAWDWSKAHIYHWLHESPSGNLSSRLLESEKDPLESRIWYNYPGESTNFGSPYYLDAAYSGASAEPSVVARVMDDGTTQLSTYGYNAFGNVTNTTDPLGRSISYQYSSNNLDLTSASLTGNGKNELLMSETYNSQHLPLNVTYAAGQSYNYNYNVRGQILSSTDPLGELTTFNYDTNGFLLSVTGPLQDSNDVFTLTYDAFNRVKAVTDTEGYTVSFTYDNLDRLLSAAYPDGTSEQFVYTNLDLAAVVDRLGRWTTNTYDANRRLTQVQDALGRITHYQYCTCGDLEAFFDPMGRETSWDYDLESRPIAKHYADGSSVTYTYENSTSRLLSTSDEKGQQTAYQYYADDDLASISYPNATVATPGVTYTYDTNYNRVVKMQDGTGATIFTYNPITPIPVPGAGALASVSGPLPDSTVTYQYDKLGRVVSQAINGVSLTVAFDQLDRLIMATNVLGTFNYAYVRATPRLASKGYPNGQTNLYSYYNNLGDQRLWQIQNLYPNGSLLSAFGYAYNAIGQITSWTNQWDSLPARVWIPSYDAVDELTNVIAMGGPLAVTNYTYGYDSAGNRTLSETNTVSDQFQYDSLNQLISETGGPTNTPTYEWDAEQRLVAINQGAHQSHFTYDGLGRRTRIVEMQNGSVVADNYFLWCGDTLCEERDSTGATVLRRFFPQGESIVGASTTNLYYTEDHLGSIREALDRTGSLQARYDYDPYGQQFTLVNNQVTSFSYGGYFRHQASGLYLTRNRGLDPRLGRWLNRDPIAEAGGLNLYEYANNDPVLFTDPDGELAWIPAILIGTAVGGLIAAAIHSHYAAKTAFEHKARLDELAKLKRQLEDSPTPYHESIARIEKEEQEIRDEIAQKDTKAVAKAGSEVNQQAVEAIGCGGIPDKVGIVREGLNRANPNILKEGLNESGH